MSIPAGYLPYVTSVRRYRFLAERSRRDQGLDGPAAVFRALRLATDGTALPSDLPARGALAAADVLAVEEVQGASIAELRAYGLTQAEGEALITHLETA